MGTYVHQMQICISKLKPSSSNIADKCKKVGLANVCW